MLNIIKSPNRALWPEILKRPASDQSYMISSVQNILNRVKIGGDNALIALTEQYDKVKLKSLKTSSEEVDDAIKIVPSRLKEAIDKAYLNIKAFHEAQKPQDLSLETMPGINCKLKYTAINNVGLYIPGGTAPLFSTVLMLGIPAVIAGSKNVYLCTPPDKNGKVNPAILYAATKCGIKNIFKVGGAQAVAAMAFGTDTIPKADKIFGPGNQFVTLAKQLINMEGVAIDMPAGPSEVAVFGDNTSIPEFIAADLLSQAEHGADSQVLLVSTDEELIYRTSDELKKQVEMLPRKEIAKKVLNSSKAVYFSSADKAFDFLNEYAPEHLIIASSRSNEYEFKVSNAGSVFMGNLTPESAGDYASGTNHTLPTNGAAKAYSGLTLLSFMKTITFQELTKQGVQNISETVETMAEFEQLKAHEFAMALRRKSLK